MSTFEKIRAAFTTNWTTVLVGWNGLGDLCPWPDRWTEYPALIFGHEICAYCDEQLAKSFDPIERDMILALLALDVRTASREIVRTLLTPLSVLCKGDPAIELRKWRLVMLEETLEHLPKDALYGLIALSEFWQSFGFPADSPHTVQGRGFKSVGPYEYYEQENLDQLLLRHRTWIEHETLALQDHMKESSLHEQSSSNAVPSNHC